MNRTLIGYDHILNFEVKGSNAKLRSYLAFMGPRLVEMHRLLKDTGSLYLHCDPTASHYLKGLLDAIFGNNKYKNEIIWHYKGNAGSTKKWGTKHDIIFYYTKSDTTLFNIQYLPYSKKHLKRFNQIDKNGKRFKWNSSSKVGKYKSYMKEGIKIEDVWLNIQHLTSEKERLGYPTQKPRALYERIIKASTNENDIVLDPFAGCGTTIDAAQALNRKWIGIDITNLALAPMERRLAENHNLIKGKDYEIIGYPTTMQEVWKFVKDEKKHHDFANWAVAQLGLQATQNIGDGGFDGVGIAQTWTAEGMKQIQGKVIAEVKTGSISKTQVRAFCQTIQDQQAIVGIIVTLYPPTKAMREYQQKLGKFEHNNKSYQKLQIWQIDDRYFEDNDSIKKQIKLPWMIEKIKKI